MSDSRPRFHLAIPCHDLDQAWQFYIDKLGCHGRRYEDRLTLNFFGAQLVCHLAPDEIASEARVYPRHFGLVIDGQDEFDALLNRLAACDIEFMEPPFVRFEGKDIEQTTFFLNDPSNNVIEFKCYRRPETMY